MMWSESFVRQFSHKASVKFQQSTDEKTCSFFTASYLLQSIILYTHYTSTAFDVVIFLIVELRDVTTMRSSSVEHEIILIDIKYVLIVVDDVRSVQNHQSSPLMIVKSTLNRRHRIFNLFVVRVYVCVFVISLIFLVVIEKLILLEIFAKFVANDFRILANVED